MLSQRAPCGSDGPGQADKLRCSARRPWVWASHLGPEPLHVMFLRPVHQVIAALPPLTSCNVSMTNVMCMLQSPFTSVTRKQEHPGKTMTTITQGKTLFDGGERSENIPMRPDESAFGFLPRTADPRFAQGRHFFEAIFSRYPEEHRSHLRGRFRSTKADQHQGAMLELLLFVVQQREVFSEGDLVHGLQHRVTLDRP